MGRSRGGFGSKLHVLTDGKGLPLKVIVSPAQHHDSRYFKPLLQSFSVFTQKGYLKTTPQAVIADRGYDAQALRQYLRQRGIQIVIPTIQRKRIKPKRGRPLQYDQEAYKKRNVVERCIGRLKQFRRLGTRFEKRAIYFEGMLQLAFLRIYLKKIDDLSDTIVSL